MLILVIILLAVALGSSNLSKTSKESLTYTQLLTKIESQEVEKLRIQSTQGGGTSDAIVKLKGAQVGAPEIGVVLNENEFLADRKSTV